MAAVTGRPPRCPSSFRKARKIPRPSATSDDSDEDEDDKEAHVLLTKKRRVAGDTLNALACDPVTAPFRATYQMALVDDVDEFAHLDRDQGLESEPESEPGRDQGEGEEDERNRRRKWRGVGREEELEEDDEDKNVEMAESSTGMSRRKEEISAAEVRKTLQEVARGEQEYAPLDPEDVSWMNQDRKQMKQTRSVCAYCPPAHQQ